MTLPAITIRQPYAHAVAAGTKPVENRGRRTRYRGPVAIHAAARPHPTGDLDPRIRSMYGDDASVGMPLGVVLAVADLVDCHQATPACVNGGCGPWGDLLYGNPGIADGIKPAVHLVFANPVPIPPVRARGQQLLLWTLPPDVEAQVRAHITEEVTA